LTKAGTKERAVTLSLARVWHFHVEDFAQAAPAGGGEADSAEKF
jgi:hypothetical protein